MNFFFFFWEYVRWHYGRAFEELLGLWKNFLWFWYHFFSMPLLVRTLFAPFHRLEIHERHVGFEEHMSNFVANTLMRVFGFVMRIFILAVGVVVMAITFCVSVISFLLWGAAPLTLLVFLCGGVFLLITG